MSHRPGAGIPPCGRSRQEALKTNNFRKIGRAMLDSDRPSLRQKARQRRDCRRLFPSQFAPSLATMHKLPTTSTRQAAKCNRRHFAMGCSREGRFDRRGGDAIKRAAQAAINQEAYGARRPIRVQDRPILGSLRNSGGSTRMFSAFFRGSRPRPRSRRPRDDSRGEAQRGAAEGFRENGDRQDSRPCVFWAPCLTKNGGVT